MRNVIPLSFTAFVLTLTAAAVRVRNRVSFPSQRDGSHCGICTRPLGDRTAAIVRIAVDPP